MSTKFVLTRDINGYNAFGVTFAENNYQTNLATNTAQSLTVPSNFQTWLAIFAIEPGSNVFIANNATAVVPGSSFAETNTQYIPTARQVSGGDVLSFITPDTSAYVGVSLYAIA